MRKIIFLILYLAAGVGLHLAFIGDRFDPMSAWAWMFVLGWPILTAFWIALAIFSAACVGAIVLLIAWLVEWRRERRVLRELIKRSEILRKENRSRPDSTVGVAPVGRDRPLQER